MTDGESERAVDAIVEAVRRRDRNFRRSIILAVLVLSMVTVINGVWVSYSVYHVASDTQNLTRQYGNVSTSLTCGLAAQARVTAQTLGDFAKRFGAEAPPIPGLPHECGGDDPIFIGTPGNDTIDGTTSPDWLNGEAGNDVLRAHGGGDTLIGDAGRDTIYGGKGTDYLYGGSGSDELHGGGDSRVDHLDGGDGTDVCFARSNDVVTNCERIVRVS